MQTDPLALDPAAHAPVVRRALRRLGVPSEALDDAVQDVFTVLVRRSADFDRTRSLTNWLWGVARGVAATHRRSRHRRARLLEALASVPVESPDLDDVITRARATTLVTEFVGRLPRPLGAVFILAHVHGLGGPEIAEQLGINLNTAYARIRAARIRFEAELVPAEATSLGTRIMRAFVPMFMASSKSIATASLTASLMWVVATVPPATATVTTATAAMPVVSVGPPRSSGAPTTPQVAKEPGVFNTPIAKAPRGAVPVTTPSLGFAAGPAKAAPARVEPSDEDSVSDYDFADRDGDRVEGVVLRPEGANIDARSRVKFPSLIGLRGHFVPELVRLAKDL